MNTIKKIALAAALALAMPAMAQTFLQPLAPGQKYRDTGAKPTGGRSGLAGIEARALLDRSGMTDIEVTTGRFEGVGGAGTLGKVQVKLFSGGALVETDNYRQGTAGNGTGTFSYDGLNKGYSAQVQANVTGIEPNRTDVVTVTTPVKRRPDLEALRLDVQPRVVLNAPVTVRGVFAETNGDVGARATCRLFADGVEVGAMAGVWIDANSAVTCEFRTSFASLGTKNLTLRVTDVEPRDYDRDNNEVSLAIAVVNANVDWFSVDVFDEDRSNTIDHSQVYRQGGVPVATYTEHINYVSQGQYLSVYSLRLLGLPPTGRITYRHASGGVPLPSVSVAVQDLEAYDESCRYGYLSSGLNVSFCAWGDDTTYIDVYSSTSSATYVEQKGLVTSSGCCDWSTYRTYSADYPGPRFPLGADYTAELLHETGEGVFGGALTLALARTRFDQDNHSCSGPSDNGTQVCNSQVYRSAVVQGYDWAAPN